MSTVDAELKDWAKYLLGDDIYKKIKIIKDLNPEKELELIKVHTSILIQYLIQHFNQNGKSAPKQLHDIYNFIKSTSDEGFSMIGVEQLMHLCEEEIKNMFIFSK